MKDYIFTQKRGQIHFIGINGVSMSGLAKYCLACGYSVSGSDRDYSIQSERLTRAGAMFYKGHSPKNVGDVQAVVYTSAIGKENPEIKEAIKRGIPIIKRSEFLGNVLRKYPNVIAVAGSHGKTTTTAMLWEILDAAGKDPTVFLGGDYGERGNFKMGKGKYAVAEACEYKKNFLDITPNIAVVLNIDNDHLESFGSIEEEIKAFRSFASKSLAVVNADDQMTRDLCTAAVTFGIKNPAVYRAKRLKKEKKGYSFGFYAYGKREGRITLKVDGLFNVTNALAAAAAASVCKIPFDLIKRGLESFSGVNRRNQIMGSILGKPVVCDYAHHPTEIAATLEIYSAAGRNPLVVFQPHTYSRTRILMSDFVQVLKDYNTIIYKTYAAREYADSAGDGKTLCKNIATAGGNCIYAADIDALTKRVYNGIKDKDCILFLGAGNIYDVVLYLIRENKFAK